MRTLQNSLARFAEFHAQVLGVSADSLETHRDFAAKLRLDFPLIADDGTIRKLYGGGRLCYLIDQAGIVRYVHRGMPDRVALERELAGLPASGPQLP